MDDNFITKLVNRMFEQSIPQLATAIHLVRAEKNLSIQYMVNNALVEHENAPIENWDKTIRRLKVLFRLVDYGPMKSTDGEYAHRNSSGKTCDFMITSNPNPKLDDHVVIVCAGDSA